MLPADSGNQQNYDTTFGRNNIKPSYLMLSLSFQHCTFLEKNDCSPYVLDHYLKKKHKILWCFPVAILIRMQKNKNIRRVFRQRKQYPLGAEERTLKKVKSMSRFLKRLEKNIEKLEKNITKEQQRIRHLEIKSESNKITKAEFNIKKKQVEEHIRAMRSRIQTLKGGMAKEKRHEDEKEEEKQKKQDEKEKKKQSKESEE